MLLQSYASDDEDCRYLSACALPLATPSPTTPLSLSLEDDCTKLGTLTTPGSVNIFFPSQAGPYDANSPTMYCNVAAMITSGSEGTPESVHGYTSASELESAATGLSLGFKILTRPGQGSGNDSGFASHATTVVLRSPKSLTGSQVLSPPSPTILLSTSPHLSAKRASPPILKLPEMPRGKQPELGTTGNGLTVGSPSANLLASPATATRSPLALTASSPSNPSKSPLTATSSTLSNQVPGSISTTIPQPSVFPQPLPIPLTPTNVFALQTENAKLRAQLEGVERILWHHECEIRGLHWLLINWGREKEVESGFTVSTEHRLSSETIKSQEEVQAVVCTLHAESNHNKALAQTPPATALAPDPVMKGDHSHREHIVLKGMDKVLDKLRAVGAKRLHKIP